MKQGEINPGLKARLDWIQEYINWLNNRYEAFDDMDDIMAEIAGLYEQKWELTKQI